MYFVSNHDRRKEKKRERGPFGRNRIGGEEEEKGEKGKGEKGRLYHSL